ncbi:hypothetical protein SAMN05216296_3127 [Pseudomonas pohangensis]|jgi:hypothetical protein|uniref:Uncharacterized protein n=1 Tax=Pseudomonas pohangensis TaxID=364197 RepID=A0A1H2HMT0_9PSED|nr:hypothetical protein SAMN05216296_3127 [Pseudomonas pohangensis]
MIGPTLTEREPLIAADSPKAAGKHSEEDAAQNQEEQDRQTRTDRQGD